MKAIKNPLETQGLLDSHVRDGMAMAEWLAWLQNEIEVNRVDVIDEISAADQLEIFRS